MASRRSGEVPLLLCIAVATIVVHLIVGDGYGFHRDELATLDDSRHLDWGYVAYPPVTPFFGWLSLKLFGTSLVGFRFFASLASAASIVVTGLIAWRTGGGRMAQLIAASAAIPFCLATGGLMQYVAFDYLCWVLTAYFIVCLIVSEDSRWWIAVGCAIGFGMLTKYSVLFLVAGVAVGVMATSLRAQLKTKWLWLGAACSVLVFLPNFLWQVQHHFISLDFLRHIHERDVRIGRTKDFLPDQLILPLFGFPIAMLGLYYCVLDEEGRRFRVLGWMYLTPLLLFVIARGRGYYLAPAYAMLYAAGAIWIERHLAKLKRGLQQLWTAIIGLALAANICIFAATVLPVAPINSKWWMFAVKNNGDLAEEIGWPDLVETIARVRDELSADDRTHLGILAGNYGEAGAVNLYGPALNLPRAICGTNSFWARGYGDASPKTVILVGFSRQFADAHFSETILAARSENRFRVPNEETSDHPDIFVCRGFRGSWSEFWRRFQRYG